MVKVKICGHTSAGDALGSVEAGADYIGVIVEVPVATPRKVTREEARGILGAVGGGAEKVMVAMPATIGEAVALYEAVKPDAIQLHGRESVQFCRTLIKRLPCKIMKVIHVKDRGSIAEARTYAEVCDYLLLDTPSPSMGGSGRTHDWGIAREIVQAVDRPVFLAGGLEPDNVQEAVVSVRPYAVDVSSGVEQAPGRKDPAKAGRFIEMATTI